MSEWRLVAQVDQSLPLGLEVEGRYIGLFAIAGRLYAVDNICPHAHALLTSGFIKEEVVECAFHNARFHLPSGKCLRGPGRDIKTYPVKQVGSDILLLLQ